MKGRSARVLSWSAVAAVAVAFAAACGGSSKAPALTKVAAPGGSKDPSKWPADDRSMCDWRNKPELEVSETIGPGALRPNVRRIYKTFGEGENRNQVLVCREIDTNLDGIKDVVRTFNTKGEAQHEEADRNYDGKIDVWINFVDGRMSEEDVDTNNDGKIDVWKFYVNGQLQRVRRDRNGDGKPDIWEIYSKGRLERVGVDETLDGHVDRWDRDEQLKYEADAAERKARETAGGDDAGVAAVPRPGIADAGAGDAGSKKGVTSSKPASSTSSGKKK